MLSDKTLNTIINEEKVLSYSYKSTIYTVASTRYTALNIPNDSRIES